jgi:hypothetical protein
MNVGLDPGGEWPDAKQRPTDTSVSRNVSSRTLVIGDSVHANYSPTLRPVSIDLGWKEVLVILEEPEKQEEVESNTLPSVWDSSLVWVSSHHFLA